ncbi:carbohydrate-binding protein [Paenibacillus gansuensis]|uniref:Carbohydrate-binding protein n=1 Tax=Paenibacillus gansuensis TaxID=306542 RepID=A0ABW5PJ99_9BACL
MMMKWKQWASAATAAVLWASVLLSGGALTGGSKAYAATAYEAEASGNTLGGAASVSACAACSGGSKVGNLGNNSGTLQFNGISAASAGTNTLVISYTAGDNTRSLQMSVNGGAATTLTFASTGGWGTPGTMQTSVTLNAGSTNTIKFFNNTGWGPDVDKISVDPAGTVYNYQQTTVTDNSGTTTMVNGGLTIVYNKTTGLSDFSWNGVRKAGNMYSEFATGTTYKSKDYTSHTFSTADVATFTDGYGNGTRVTFVNSAAGKPSIRQNFYIYDGKPYFFVDLNVTNGTSLSTNYMAPIKIDSGATSINGSSNKRALLVPYDNDEWSRYNANSVNASGNGYEVFATYDNDSRNGLIFGSITHSTWKTGIWYFGTGNNVTELQVYGGAADGNTRDNQSHGSLSGTSVWSPKIMIGYYSDWRDGMEAYGAVNAIENGSMSWTGGVPFGWNSWGSIQTGLNYDIAVAHSNWIKNNLQNNNFNSNNTAYINLDSYWDNMTDQQLTDFAATVHANGQKAGIYWTPFVYWGTDMNRQVEGSTYKYGDIILRKYDGTNQSQRNGGYPVDPTHPGTKDRINYFIDKFKAKGYDFIKLDFMIHGALEGQHYDSAVKTGTQAYNQGMQYIKTRINGTMFISLSIAPLFPSQYAHARRISCDVYGTISGVNESTEYMLNNLTYGWWQNGTIYKFTDPDHMKLSSDIEEARSRVNSGAIAGTVFLNGDDLRDTASQARASQLLTNNQVNGVARKGKAFRAIEGNTGSGAANAFVLNDGAGVYYLAVFNYSTTSGTTVSVNLGRAGLNGSTSYTVTDLWTGGTSTASGSLSVTLGAKQSKLFKLN